MKGDLSTLKKVCRYASLVMLAGEVIFAVLLSSTVILGVAQFLVDDAEALFLGWIGADAGDGEVGKASAFGMSVLIHLMGFVTVRTVHDVMVSIVTEHSPFVLENAARLKTVSLSFLFSSVFFLSFGLLANKELSLTLMMFFGSLMVSVVMYCLTIICRYGALLQKESDETL